MLKRKIRQIGNSIAFTIPNEIFEFLNLELDKIKYKLCQDETGKVYILILDKNVIMIDEKNFQKSNNSPAIIIPKSLCNMWNLGLGENQNREIKIYQDESPLKWGIEPV